MNGTKRTGTLTRSALDALVIVNYKRFFDSSADRSHRTVSCALGTSLAALRTDNVSSKCSTSMRNALLIHHMLHILIPEQFQCTHNRQSRTLPETAKSCLCNHICQFLQKIQIFQFSVACHDPLQNLQHPLGTFPARHTFSTALILRKIHKEPGNLHHTSVVIHDNQTAGTDHCSHLLKRIKIQIDIQMPCNQTSAGRSADLYCLKFTVLFDSAADIVNHLS